MPAFPPVSRWLCASVLLCSLWGGPLMSSAAVIVASPASSTPVFGSTVALTANVTAEPGAAYVWERDGVEIINGGRYSGATTASLVIAHANGADSGSYQLTVTDEAGAASTVPAVVTVNQNDSALDANAGVTVTGPTQAVLPLPDGRVLLASNHASGTGGTQVTGQNLVVIQVDGRVTALPAGAFNGLVYNLHLKADGKILVQGIFSRLGGVPKAGIAQLNADLTLDTGFVGPANLSSDASTAISSDAAGNSYVRGVTDSGLGRLLPSGARDATFEGQQDLSVRGMVRQQNGRVVVVGKFGLSNGSQFTNSVRYLRSGVKDNSYTPLAGESSGLAIDAEDRLFSIDTAMQPSNFNYLLRRWGKAGGFEPGYTRSFYRETGLDTYNGMALWVQPDGKLVIAGAGVLYRTKPSGLPDSTFASGIGFNNEVTDLKQDARGRLWVTGSFTHLNEAALQSLAVLQGMASSLAFTFQPQSQDVMPAADVKLQAAVTANNGYTLRWHKDGVALEDGPWLSGCTTPVLTVRNMAAEDAGDYTLVASSPGGSLTSKPASLYLIGSPDLTMEPVSQTVDVGADFSLQVAASEPIGLLYEWYHRGEPLTDDDRISGANSATLRIYPMGTIHAGEYYVKVTNIHGEVTSSTALVTVRNIPANLALVPQPSFNGAVNDIELLADGTYLVGGDFTSVTVNGETTGQKYICRILADGTVDPDFRPLLDNGVSAIAVDDMGFIFLAGSFTRVTPEGSDVYFPRLRVCRFLSDFTFDESFDTVAGPNNTVTTLAPVGDGSVFIGGSFTQIGGVNVAAVRYAARLESDGSRDSSFVSRADGPVEVMKLRSDGKLYIGGTMTNWERGAGEKATRLVLVQPTGQRIKTFRHTYDGGTINTIQALHITRDGHVIVGQQGIFDGETGKQITPGVTSKFVHDLAEVPQAEDVDPVYVYAGADGLLLRGTVPLLQNGTFRTLEVDAFGRVYVGGSFIVPGQVGLRTFAILNGGVNRTVAGIQAYVPNYSQVWRRFTFGNGYDGKWNGQPRVGTIHADFSSGLPASYEILSGPATVSGDQITVTAAGEIVIQVSQPGSAEYAPAEPVIYNLTVAKGEQPILWGQMLDRPKDSGPVVLSTWTASNLPVSFTVLSGPASVSGNVLTLSGQPGLVEIQATQAGDANWNAATPVIRRFRVTEDAVVPVAQKIAFTLPTKAYQSEVLELLAAASSDLPVTLAVDSGPATLAGGQLSFTGTGVVKVRATQAGNASVRAAVPVVRTLTVVADPAALTLINLLQTYDGTPKAIGTVGGTGVPVITYKIGETLGTEPPVNAGTYAVEAVIGTGATAVKKSGKLVIAKAPLILMVDNQMEVYGMATSGRSYQLSGLRGADTRFTALSKQPSRYISTHKSNSPSGRYSLTVIGAESLNYALTIRPGTLVYHSFAGSYETLLTGGSPALPVGKLELTVAATNQTFTGKLHLAGEAAAVLLKGSLTVNEETEMLEASFLKIQGVNYYDIAFALPIEGPGTAEVELFGGPLGASANVEKLWVPKPGQKAAHAGAYTLTLPQADEVLPGEPAGVGHAVATVDAKGGLKLVTVLADGAKFTAALPADGTANTGHRLFVRPYKAGRTGSYVAGLLKLKPHGNIALRRVVEYTDAQNLTWVKSAGEDAGYRAGFGPTALRVVLDPWLPPVKKPTAITLAERLGLNLDNPEFEVLHSATGSESNADLPLTLRLAANGTVGVVAPVTVPANRTRWKVTLNAATGAFTGSFDLVDDGETRKVPFTGMLRQPPATDGSRVIGYGTFQMPALRGAESDEVLSGEVRLKLPELDLPD
ncbi:MBG domain-containing protein [Prosthecobacter algae]